MDNENTLIAKDLTVDEIIGLKNTYEVRYLRYIIYGVILVLGILIYFTCIGWDVEMHHIFIAIMSCIGLACLYESDTKKKIESIAKIKEQKKIVGTTYITKKGFHPTAGKGPSWNYIAFYSPIENMTKKVRIYNQIDFDWMNVDDEIYISYFYDLDIILELEHKNRQIEYPHFI